MLCRTVEVSKWQQFGKISSAEVSLRKAMKEIIAVSWPSCSALVSLSLFLRSHMLTSLEKPLPRLSRDFPCSLTNIICRLATISSSGRRRKILGRFFLWLNQNKMHCLVYSPLFYTQNTALHSHLTINRAHAKHIKLNTECIKNGNGTKTEL